MNKIIKILSAIVIIEIIALFVVFYLDGSLEKFGLCKPGEKIIHGAWGNGFCYKPSGYDGQPCNKQTDCGKASCILVDDDKTIEKEGICEDWGQIYHCGYLLDKDGNKEKTMCAD